MSGTAFKRIMDLVGATLALLLLSPVMLIVAAAIRLTTGAPVFFLQYRTGQHGHKFRVIKFRTMTVDSTVEVGKETAENDPRITPVGQLLRRMGLDEVPQLFNVLLGQMSLVGPRPLLQWENDLCSAEQARRLLVRPGVTGLCQVRGRNGIPWAKRMQWDIHYVDRMSLWLDFYILLRTVPVVLRGENAYGDAQLALPLGSLPAAPMAAGPVDYASASLQSAGSPAS